MTNAQTEALKDLKNIMSQLEDLSAEVAEIMIEHFPHNLNQLESYDAANFGTSSNSFNTTFATELRAIELETV